MGELDRVASSGGDSPDIELVRTPQDTPREINPRAVAGPDQRVLMDKRVFVAEKLLWVGACAVGDEYGIGVLGPDIRHLCAVHRPSQFRRIRVRKGPGWGLLRARPDLRVPRP